MRDRAAVGAFVVGSILAGGNGVGVRYSNRELDPFWGAALRFAIAAALFAAIMGALRLALPRGRALAGALVYGALNFGGAFGFAYYGLVEVHAGLGQTLLALVPLLTLLLAVAQRQERLRLAALVGAMLAIVGIAVISRTPLRESVPLVSLLAVLGSALCFAQAAVVARWFPSSHPVTTNALGSAVGAAVLFLAALVAGDSLDLPRDTDTLLAIGYLVTLGTVAVFVLYLYVLRHWAASRAAFTFVVIPIVTILLSAWLDDEPVRLGLLVGGVLVLAGVYVGALRRPGAPVH
jgi:drug/metabolite transporter (DMT)-like permease